MKNEMKNETVLFKKICQATWGKEIKKSLLVWRTKKTVQMIFIRSFEKDM